MHEDAWRNHQDGSEQFPGNIFLLLWWVMVRTARAMVCLLGLHTAVRRHFKVHLPCRSKEPTHRIVCSISKCWFKELAASSYEFLWHLIWHNMTLQRLTTHPSSIHHGFKFGTRNWHRLLGGPSSERWHWQNLRCVEDNLPLPEPRFHTDFTVTSADSAFFLIF